jgi:protein-S-isoprenylcysteine O-methyltransferase Ste14
MSSELLIRIIALLLILGVFTVSGYYRRGADRADKAVDTRAENKPLLIIRSLGAIGFYFGLLAYLLYPPVMAWGALGGWPQAARWLGLALMALNLPLLVWMFRSLGKNITPTVKTRAKHQLVVSGPYRYIRHPLYTFGGFFFLGAALVAGNWFLFACAIIAIWALFSRTPLEERMLVERFGSQYEEYMRTTGRYLPRL